MGACHYLVVCVWGIISHFLIQSYAQRMNLNIVAASVVFVTIVVLQIAAILTATGRCQSTCGRRASINCRLIFAVVLCLALVAALIFGLLRLSMIDLRCVE